MSNELFKFYGLEAYTCIQEQCSWAEYATAATYKEAENTIRKRSPLDRALRYRIVEQFVIINPNERWDSRLVRSTTPQTTMKP